jgi:hypothetical protein
VTEESAFFTTQAVRNGLTHWHTTLEDYLNTLTNLGFRAWRIDSAIGFEGFVIARGVEGYCAKETIGSP